jgi:hypothetical protein
MDQYVHLVVGMVWKEMIKSFKQKHMNLNNISIERLQEIEAERAQTKSDPNFQAWMDELKVGKLYEKKDGIIRAQQMMADWNQSNLKSQSWEWMSMG